jgi:hypothetical protein
LLTFHIVLPLQSCDAPKPVPWGSQRIRRNPHDIDFRRRTTKRLVHAEACTRCGWNQSRAVTLQQVYNRAHKRHIYYNNDSNESRYKYTIQRSKSYRRSNASEYGQDTNLD